MTQKVAKWISLIVCLSLRMPLHSQRTSLSVPAMTQSDPKSYELKKEMIACLCPILAQVIPIHQNFASLDRLTKSKNTFLNCFTSKKKKPP